MAVGQSNIAPTCLQEPRKEYPPTRGFGSGLVSLIPYLGDALGVVGKKRRTEMKKNISILCDNFSANWR